MNGIEKYFIIALFVSLLIGCVTTLQEVDGMKKDGKMTTIKGIVENTRYAPSVNGVYLMGKNMEQYIGKNVEATGTVTEKSGDQVVNEKGEYSAGISGPYKVMNVSSIKVVE